MNFTIPPNVELHYEILVSVVTFDLFGYFIEDVNFGQTETEPYSEGLDTLKYDSINILTNMFSVHVFITLLIMYAIFSFVLQFSCCRIPDWRVCKMCRSAQSSKISEYLVVGALRIFLTGFLEILICSYIGMGIFNLSNQMS